MLRKQDMKKKGVFWGVLGGNKGEGKVTCPVLSVVKWWKLSLLFPLERRSCLVRNIRGYNTPKFWAKGGKCAVMHQLDVGLAAQGRLFSYKRWGLSLLFPLERRSCLVRNIRGYNTPKFWAKGGKCAVMHQLDVGSAAQGRLFSCKRWGLSLLWKRWGLSLLLQTK